MQKNISLEVAQHMKRMRRFDSNPINARFARMAGRLMRALEEGIMPWNPRAMYKNVFFLGGITHVPHKEFPDHLDFFMAMANMLRFRYDLNPQFALLDNEVSLNRLPSEVRPFACYTVDQACTQRADFIIAELSVPSTGTGQELERARQARVPVIALAKREIRKEVTPSVFYEGITSQGERRFHEVQRGVSSISLMVEGNPALTDFFDYANNGHVGRTEALIGLDKRVSEIFGLRSASVRIIKILSDVSEFESDMRGGVAGKRTVGRFVQQERLRLHSEKLAVESDRDPALTDAARMDMIRSIARLEEALDKSELGGKAGQFGFLKGPILHRLQASTSQLRALDELLRFPHDHSTFYYQRMFPDNKRLPLADSMRGELKPSMVEVRAIRDEETQAHLEAMHDQNAAKKP